MSKPPWEWNEDDLQNLISSSAMENIELDYKRSEALAKTPEKKKELSKDVSAFANSAGGTLIYGMIEDGHIPTGLDAGLDPTEISKEWIEQVINSTIQRRIDGIRIKAIPLTTASNGRVAYIVHVPQSTRAPHQATDKKFYKRFNFESVPMEEYEVRDVARRFEVPQLSIRCTFGNNKPLAPLRSSGVQKRDIALHLSMFNSSSSPAHHISISLYVDENLKFISIAGWKQTLDWPRLRVHGVDRKFGRIRRMWLVPEEPPVFEGEDFPINPPMVFAAPPGDGTFFFFWVIKAPQTPTVLDGMKIMVLGDNAELVPLEPAFLEQAKGMV